MGLGKLPINVELPTKAEYGRKGTAVLLRALTISRRFYVSAS